MKKIKLVMVFVLAILTVPVFAQRPDSTRKQTEKKSYSCPMHPDMVSHQPGKCSKCNMDLKEVKKEKIMYACPMHSEITSSQPGKCSKCGKDLMRTPKEKMKMEVMHRYSCPMHPEITSDKPGNCSKCGMALKEKEAAHGHE